eukprot:398108_1
MALCQVKHIKCFIFLISFFSGLFIVTQMILLGNLNHHFVKIIYTNSKYHNISKESNCLIILFGQARASNITFESFKRHLLEPTSCDLALSVGLDTDRDTNPFYKAADYVWIWDEHQFDHLNLTNYAQFWDMSLKHLYNLTIETIKTDAIPILIEMDFDKALQTMDSLFLFEHGSLKIHLFFRQFTYFHIKKLKLLQKYDYFLYFRSDYRYLCDFPLNKLTVNRSIKDRIWIGKGEEWGGIQDRNLLAHKSVILAALNELMDIIMNYKVWLNTYPDIAAIPRGTREDEQTFQQQHMGLNPETILKQHLIFINLWDKILKYDQVQFLVRSSATHTRWSEGWWSKKQQAFVKYPGEYKNALHTCNQIDRNINESNNTKWKPISFMFSNVEMESISNTKMVSIYNSQLAPTILIVIPIHCRNHMEIMRKVKDLKYGKAKIYWHFNIYNLDSCDIDHEMQHTLQFSGYRNLNNVEISTYEIKIKIKFWIHHIFPDKYGADYIWFVDEDMQFENFNFLSFIQIARYLNASISQPGIQPKCIGCKGSYWSDLNVNNIIVKSGLVAKTSDFVELQCPLLTINAWKMAYSLIVKLWNESKYEHDTDTGYDLFWCGAAQKLLPNENACIVIYYTPMVHLDQQTLNKTKAFYSQGYRMYDEIVQKIFPTYYHNPVNALKGKKKK